ncbi:MAG: hypothetical protein ISS19_13405 [Bacteroidales bacterium]|nr:hypothetical protein [Bacteroidales bacterium]
MKINHYHNKDIDLDKWDKCVQNAINPAIYPLSWYLHITSPDWEGLFSDDYKTIVPLPIVKKLGRQVVYQPEFTWQLGIFSSESLNPGVVENLLSHIPSKYRIGSYHLNKYNVIESGKYAVYPLQTTELQLISSYDKIRAEYKSSLHTRVERAKQNRVSMVKSITNHDFVNFAYKFDRFNTLRLNPTRLILLRQIVSNAIRYRMGEIYGAYTKENNLCAAIFLIHYKGRSIIHYAVSDNDGIESGALYMMIDNVIITHSGKSIILSVDDPFNSNLSDLLKYFGAKSYTFTKIKTKRFLLNIK